MNIYRIDPATGAEIRFHTHRSGGYGQYREKPLSIFRKGETYTFQLDWQSTNNDSQAASGGTHAEGPDYDYTFKVEPEGAYPGKLIPSWDSATGATNGTALAVTGASNVADTQQEFEENYERRRVALVCPKLEWQVIEGFDNLDTHIDPWTNQAKGKRIFPCRKNPNDSQIRHKLKLVAIGGLKGVEVYVKSFDIDDGTSEAFDVDANGTNPIIDTNGKAGDDNLPDQIYQTAKTGQFRNNGVWPGNTLSKALNEAGRAEFEFKVGMQPGSNYRAVLSVGSGQDFTGVQVGVSDEPGYLGAEIAQTGDTIASEPLTVWRRLWVENDSMKAVNNTGGAGANFFPVTVDYVVQDALATIPDPGAVVVSELIPNTQDYYENGFFRPASGGEWKVFRTRLLPDNSHIITYGVLAGVSGAAKLFDDDGRGLIAAQLPRLDLVNEQMKAYFRPSFIEATDAVAYNSTKLLDFKPNEDAFPTDTLLDDTRNLVDVPSLWVCTVVAAYQGAEDVDLDPNGADESQRLGETSGFDGNDQFSVVYVEACREMYWTPFLSSSPSVLESNRARLHTFINATVAHEMGHHPGTQTEEEDHAENQLMSASMADVSTTTPEDSKFSRQTIKRFRKAKRWAD